MDTGFCWICSFAYTQLLIISTSIDVISTNAHIKKYYWQICALETVKKKSECLAKTKVIVM